MGCHLVAGSTSRTVRSDSDSSRDGSPADTGAPDVRDVGFTKETGAQDIAVDLPIGPFGPEPNVAHWKFDETTGASAKNAVVGGPDGVLQGGPTWQPSLGLGGALQFDGVDDQVDIGAFNLLAGREVSISVWFRADELGRPMRFISKADNSATARHLFAIGITPLSGIPGVVEFRLATDALQRHRRWAPGVKLEVQRWYHMVAWYQSGTGMKIYLDGAEVALNTGSALTGIILNNDIDTKIGNQSDAATEDNKRPYRGLLDDMRIYSWALSEADIATLYNAGLPSHP